MKKQLLTIITITLASAWCQAQTSNKQHMNMKKIEQTIHAFAKAGDAQDAEQLDKLLDPNYRVVMNRLFGSTEVSVLPRSVYMDKIKAKEFGGDNREVRIDEVIINHTIATAKATFIGEKMTFISNLQLIQNNQGDWKLVSDIPYVQ
jgi:hypothetical protein